MDLIDSIYIDGIRSKLFEMMNISPPDIGIFNNDVSIIDMSHKMNNRHNFEAIMSMKDYLILDNGTDMMSRYKEYISARDMYNHRSINQNTTDFSLCDMYDRREMLIKLLFDQDNLENQYLAYLLYDMMASGASSGDRSSAPHRNGDTCEQTMIYNSFPWRIKTLFKYAMKITVQYTNTISSSFDPTKIPIEQQICLLRVPAHVKDKAMMKMRELKGKTDDSGAKARQYIDGILKIPFGIFKRENILCEMDDICGLFSSMVDGNCANLPKNILDDMFSKFNIDMPVANRGISPKSANSKLYTSFEIKKIVNRIKFAIFEKTNVKQLTSCLLSGDKMTMCRSVVVVNALLRKYSTCCDDDGHFRIDDINGAVECDKISNLMKTMPRPELKSALRSSLGSGKEVPRSVWIELGIMAQVGNPPQSDSDPLCGAQFGLSLISRVICDMDAKFCAVHRYMNSVSACLNKSVHGHTAAKTQIEKIIGQWVTGTQDGYCFGFEGPPGVGKTSLAKNGLSECLVDDDGNSRPFSMIQIGGDSNGSTLHGHNYTYVGSTWGSIVQILIDKKCMNPIIFIDEVDKISRTENGKEIIGILKHLLDSTKNDVFHDKYFNGIDLDLSKCLFVLSYNDPSLIDRVLLDRIHRVKFDILSIDDKLVIAHTHILPDLYSKMGMTSDIVRFPDETVRFIIDEYTLEPGVRKLKEVLFEIIGEINLDFLKNSCDGAGDAAGGGTTITIDDVKTKYLKDKPENILRMVPDIAMVGFINGMYATSLGNGGTLPIQCLFYPCDKFLDLKLTGLQQCVMQESMHISLTIAWNMTGKPRQMVLRKKYDTSTTRSGINIHPGDGSVQKDGPSAGCAITVAIFSLLNDRPIKAHCAVTGEIQMNGDITAIGGLASKITGSLKCGVTTFLFPADNCRDLDKFVAKHQDDGLLDEITFLPVSHITDAIGFLIE